MEARKPSPIRSVLKDPSLVTTEDVREAMGRINDAYATDPREARAAELDLAVIVLRAVVDGRPGAHDRARAFVERHLPNRVLPPEGA